MAANPSFPASRKSLLQTALLLAILAPLAVLLTGPIWDGDVWWHLATGRVLASTQHFLQADPFTFVSPTDLERSFLLNGYWLAQLLFYASYAVAGVVGVIAFKAALLLAIEALIFWQAVRKGHHPGVVIVIVSLCGWLSFSFKAERPQLFSMLFFVILMFLLSEVGFSGRYSGAAAFRYNLPMAICLPPLMLIWANCHPGFVLGSVVLIIYLLAETVNLLRQRNSAAAATLAKLALIVLASLAITGLNPNHFAAYHALLGYEGSDMQRRTTEYLSPVTLWLQNGIIIAPFFLYAGLLLTLSLRYFRKLGLSFALIGLFLLAISFKSYRYIPFLVFGTAAETIGFLATVVSDNKRLSRAGSVLAACCLLLLWYGGAKAAPHAYETVRSPVDTGRFPVGAANFLKTGRVSGRLFNHFNWGGYLGWRLYPEHRVFIDGRCLNAQAFTDFTRILWTDEWKEILRRRNINTIIMPAVDDFTGELYQLVNAIAVDSSWHLVYCDDFAFIAIDESAGPGLVAGKEVPKIALYRQAAFKAENMVQRGLNNVAVWQTLATAYDRLGLFDLSAEARYRASVLSR